MWKIIYLVIKKFEIQSAMSFGIVKNDDVAHEGLFNISVYDSIRDIFFQK
jgi:deoxyxylulose-5-phosphate synthase